MRAVERGSCSPLEGEHARLFGARRGVSNRRGVYDSPPSLSLPLKGGGENKVRFFLIHNDGRS